MKCNDFKCVYEVDGECEAAGGECIGCQQRDQEECDGHK